MEQELIASKLAELEAREKSNTKRLDKLENIVDNIRDLTASVQLLASKQGDMVKAVEKLDSRMGAVEAEPAKKWRKVVETVLGALAAALVGFALARIGM